MFRTLIVSAAAVAGLLSVAPAQAAGRIEIAVSTAGLDMGTSAGAAMLDHRLHVAAVKACMESAGFDNEMAAEGRIDGCVRDKVAAALAGAPAALAAAVKAQRGV